MTPMFYGPICGPLGSTTCLKSLHATHTEHVYIYNNMPIHIYTSTKASIYLYIYIYTNIHLHLHLCTSTFTSKSACIDVHIYIYLYSMQIKIQNPYTNAHVYRIHIVAYMICLYEYILQLLYDYRLRLCINMHAHAHTHLCSEKPSRSPGGPPLGIRPLWRPTCPPQAGSPPVEPCEAGSGSEPSNQPVKQRFQCIYNFMYI